MKLYLVRHGETDWNVQKRLQGRTDIELNENGRLLARKTADALKEVPFYAAFSSPLKRAEETARIILGKRQIPVVCDERIIEIGFGIYEGMGSGAANYEIPDPSFSDFFEGPQRYKAPKDGEQLESLCIRTKEFLHDITSREEFCDKTLLVVSHGAAIRGLLHSLNEEDKDYRDFWNGSVPKNLSVSILESHDNKTIVLGENRVYY